jgi:hypothetical protein
LRVGRRGVYSGRKGMGEGPGRGGGREGDERVATRRRTLSLSVAFAWGFISGFLLAWGFGLPHFEFSDDASTPCKFWF